jgi:transcriptional regulator with XRE-family HTH domain
MTTDNTEAPDTRAPGTEGTHPICVLLRELRHAAGLSLADIERIHGLKAVVLGAYERGDRTPPLSKLDWILRTVYGYELKAVPLGTNATRLSGDVVFDLRTIADQLEEKHTLSAVS